ncbi:MAG: ComF family protein [Woeseiaceae bacterium]
MNLRLLPNMLLPVHCIFCGVRCESHEVFICDGCVADLPWQDELSNTDVAPLSTVAALFAYAFPLDVALKSLKFRRRLDYVPGLGELLWQAMRELPADIDALLPMPLHWRRQAMRGFNQAHELARILRRKTALPIVRSVRRARPTAFQSGLDEPARRRNLRSAFVAVSPVVANHVLIVDDVITTGESCKELAKVVLEAGAGKVSALAVARVGGQANATG